MNRKLSVLLMIVLGLTLSACAGNKKKDQVTTETQQAVESIVDEANAYNTGYTKSDLEALGIIGDPLNYRTIYFEYNSTAIDERSSIIASAHARNLAATGSATVTLEGHADERGTRDYNLALGERRSKSVADLMSAVGAGSSSLNSISYGEEKPVDSAHNDSAWQKNRRVEISY